MRSECIDSYTVKSISSGMHSEAAQEGKFFPSPNVFAEVTCVCVQVAEMTGRKGRVVQTDDGNVIYESRSEQDVPLEILNIKGKQDTNYSIF